MLAQCITATEEFCASMTLKLFKLMLILHVPVKVSQPVFIYERCLAFTVVNARNHLDWGASIPHSLKSWRSRVPDACQFDSKKLFVSEPTHHQCFRSSKEYLGPMAL